MSTTLNVYEVCVNYTESVRLLIRADSSDAAGEIADSMDWDRRDVIDREVFDFSVSDVTCLSDDGRPV